MLQVHSQEGDCEFETGISDCRIRVCSEQAVTGQRSEHIQAHSEILTLLTPQDLNSVGSPALAPPHLGTAICFSGNTEANEDWICHFDKNVVYTVHMDVLDATLLHVIQDFIIHQSTIQATIAIYNTGEKRRPWLISDFARFIL